MKLRPFIFALLVGSSAVDSKPIWEKYQRKDWVGCEPQQLSMNVFDDSYCFRPTNGSTPVSKHQFSLMTGGRCINMGQYSYKGSCDMMKQDTSKLHRLSIEYFSDSFCTNKDAVRSQGDQLGYHMFKCMPHPFEPGKYTRMEPIYQHFEVG